MFLVFILAGCQKETKRSEAYAEAVCELHETCETLSAFGYASAKECIEQVTDLSSTISADKEKSQICLDEIYDVNCEDLYAEETMPACFGDLE